MGISGWNYPPWRGVFYPRGLKQAAELEYASRAFSTIEINGSFYSLQRPSTYQSWYERTPQDFVFAVKGGRYITHLLRLKGVEQALANFFASGVLALRDKLGPILWQLPPQLAFDEDRVARFFELLPKTTAEAAALARGHGPRLEGRSWFEIAEDAPIRHAVEVRHVSFLDPRYCTLLRQHGIAACVADSAGLFPAVDAETADFAYVRLHGATELYTSGYSDEELSRWARYIRARAAGRSARAPAQGVVRFAAPRGERLRSGSRDVYVYFDNDVKVRAPFDAMNLARLLASERALEAPVALAGVTEEPRQEWPAWAMRR